MASSLLLDPVAPAIVAGGAIAVAAMRSTAGDCRAAIASLGPLLRARPERDAQAARVAVNRIAEQARVASIGSVDRAPVVERFLARAAAELADAPDPDAFRSWGEDEIAARADRHAAVHAVWTAAADAAPALGMVGTVVALIGMFSTLDDPAAIGPGLALALTTTLWGILMANLIAGPIAARLERLSRAEIAWQTRALDGLRRIAEREMAPADSGPIGRRVASIEARLRAA